MDLQEPTWKRIVAVRAWPGQSAPHEVWSTCPGVAVGGWGRGKADAAEFGCHWLLVSQCLCCVAVDRPRHAPDRRSPKVTAHSANPKPKLDCRLGNESNVEDSPFNRGHEIMEESEFTSEPMCGRARVPWATSQQCHTNVSPKQGRTSRPWHPRALAKPVSHKPTPLLDKPAVPHNCE